jgi:hypothetical protein
VFFVFCKLSMGSNESIPYWIPNSMAFRFQRTNSQLKEKGRK